MITSADLRTCAIHEDWKIREARRAAALARVPAPELVSRVLQLERAITDLRLSLNQYLKQNRS